METFSSKWAQNRPDRSICVCFYCITDDKSSLFKPVAWCLCSTKALHEPMSYTSLFIWWCHEMNLQTSALQDFSVGYQQVVGGLPSKRPSNEEPRCIICRKCGTNSQVPDDFRRHVNQVTSLSWNVAAKLCPYNTTGFNLILGMCSPLPIDTSWQHKQYGSLG